jgi:hypothetical protein
MLFVLGPLSFVLCPLSFVLCHLSVAERASMARIEPLTAALDMNEITKPTRAETPLGWTERDPRGMIILQTE